MVHQIQQDLISRLPKELSLCIFSFLPPKDLLKTAQTCTYWNILAADDLIWKRKCRLYYIQSPISPFKSAFMRQHCIEMNWRYRYCLPLELKGHRNNIITCVQMFDNTIVSGSNDNTLKVWNASTGKCLQTLLGHTGTIWSTQIFGDLIVSGSSDKTVKVWNAVTGECIHTLFGHTDIITCLDLHNNIVVSGSDDTTLRVWDIMSGRCKHVLVGHDEVVRCVKYNGTLVVSVTCDYEIRVWKPDKEECLHTLQESQDIPVHEELSIGADYLKFDGCHVASQSFDGRIRLWNVETGQCELTFMGHLWMGRLRNTSSSVQRIRSSCMELKDNILISGYQDCFIKIWDIISGECLKTLSGPGRHHSAVTCLQFNNKFVVTSDSDRKVKVWDSKTGRFLRDLGTLNMCRSTEPEVRMMLSDTKLVFAVNSWNILYGKQQSQLFIHNFDA